MFYRRGLWPNLIKLIDADTGKVTAIVFRGDHHPDNDESAFDFTITTRSHERFRALNDAIEAAEDQHRRLLYS